MWLFAIFDLPVETQQNRRDYTRFRTALVKAGFSRLQFSVYARFLPSEDAAAVCKTIVKAMIPPSGEVRLLSVTDHQFGKMEIFLGKKRKAAEHAPDQITLF